METMGRLAEERKLLESQMDLERRRLEREQEALKKDSEKLEAEKKKFEEEKRKQVIVILEIRAEIHQIPRPITNSLDF